MQSQYTRSQEALQRKIIYAPIRHQRVDLVAVRREAPQLDLLGVLDLLCVAVTPFERHVTVGIGVHQDVECAVAVQHWQERDGCCDLAEERLDFLLDFGLRLLGSGCCSVGALFRCGVLLIL